MAGDRQHILPQLLLKGFASRIKGKEIYTYVYRKGEKPFETNIKNTAVGRNFYEIKGGLCVDDDITKFEGEYAPLLDDLRKRPGQIEIFDPRVANLITHIVTRTKHIRDSFRESSEFLSDKIFEFFSNFDNFKALILSNPELIGNYVEEKLKDSPAPHAEKEMLRQLFPLIMPALLDTQKTEMSKFFRRFMEVVKIVTPKAIKEGHIKGLSQTLIPELRVETYRGLRWFLSDSGGPLILGDIGCLFEFMGGKRFRSIDLTDDDIKNIFLPISNGKVLMGTSLAAIPHMDLNVINEEIAKCSREFFISSKRSVDILSLVPFIGNESEIISKEELETIAKENIKNFKAELTLEKGGNGDRG